MKENKVETMKENKKKKVASANIHKHVEHERSERDCPVHGSLRARGRVFEGTVMKKFSNRVVILFERMIYVRKYERYSKSRTKIHARLPVCMENTINVGDYIKVQECRPLSKIIHFVVIEKIRNGDLR